MRILKRLLSIVVMSLAFGLMASCGGSGVDRSNPQSVAEKALECYHKGDYEGLKTLVNPENKYLVSQLENMAELASKYKAEHPENKPTPVTYSFKSMSDGLRGGDITPSTTTVRVYFECENWPRTVVLEKKDGNWYLEQFK